MKTILTLLLTTSLGALADAPSDTVKGDNFQITAPVQLTGGTPAPAQAPQVDTVTYQGGLGGNVMSLTVAYIDYQPGEVAKIGFNQIIYDIGNSGPFKVAKDATLNSFQTTDNFGQINVEYTSHGTGSDGNSIWCEAHFYPVGDRIYELIAFYEPDSKNFNAAEDVGEFFNSFKLTGGK
jgi:hypothetical protein